MKTHELARALKQLGDILSASPNLELREVCVASADTVRKGRSSNMAVSLSTLVDLARVDKQQWLSFIEENQFPIETRPRDAARDILGKLLVYLEENAEARQKLKAIATRKAGGQASPELMKALAYLLKENKENNEQPPE